MHYAIDVAPLGELADPHAIVRLAVAAEAAGWDGLSTWDSLGVAMGTAAADPFVALAAAASATTRLRLILSVVVLPRRRPQLVAQSVATLDRWSEGRLVLGVGSGGDRADYETFGEPFDPGPRVARMDEGIELVDALLRGDAVTHEGPAYSVRGASIRPAPAVAPRPPIWLGGMRPGALRRAARLDGWIGIATSEDGSSLALTPAAFGDLADRLTAERAIAGRLAEPFDIALFARSEPTERALVRAYEEAGATWWLESLSPARGSITELLARVEAGPPR